MFPIPSYARVAELADALDLGSETAKRRFSIKIKWLDSKYL